MFPTRNSHLISIGYRGKTDILHTAHGHFEFGFGRFAYASLRGSIQSMDR